MLLGQHRAHQAPRRQPVPRQIAEGEQVGHEVGAAALPAAVAEGQPERAVLAGPPPRGATYSRRRKWRCRGPRHWRTREDPFEGVWGEVLVWLQAEPDATRQGADGQVAIGMPGPTGSPRHSCEPCNAG